MSFTSTLGRRVRPDLGARRSRKQVRRGRIPLAAGIRGSNRLGYEMSHAGEGDRGQLLEALPEVELLSRVAGDLAGTPSADALARDFDCFAEAVAKVLLRRSFPGLLAPQVLDRIARDVALSLVSHPESAARLKRMWVSLSQAAATGRPGQGGNG